VIYGHGVMGVTNGLCVFIIKLEIGALGTGKLGR